MDYLEMMLSWPSNIMFEQIGHDLLNKVNAILAIIPLIEEDLAKKQVDETTSDGLLIMQHNASEILKISEAMINYRQR